ncbi:T9SS type A sorting domain-containing protein [Sabulilitoribacter arenilitoris]|uniref:T9SS type A sorting domain-containing protein n=1 Tax=Wocania arenilitoris TaxID=2044858 RepID=A0AAE3JK79_9FLAO|nr:LamG-like jellyroll fold domain-containing protein [Wocania arenilitoris]MCF7567833.1 T9SS type A sorting domain-containing protein [Wocania arenilitoris]
MKIRLLIIILVFATYVIQAQTCDGNTFPTINQPTTCTYSYTSTGWKDSLGNPTSAPTSNGSSQSICIFEDYTGDLNFNIKGTLYIAPSVTYTGAVSSFGGSNLLVEGEVNFTNSPTFAGNNTVVGANGTININGSLIPQGDATVNNAGILNVSGDFNMGGQANFINYTGSRINVQGNSSINASLDNCGIFELFGSLSSGGSSGLKNLCSTYIHTNMNLNADYTNDALMIIDGLLNFGTAKLYNNSTILINNITLNNDDLIGNDLDSFLIVRNSAILSSGGSITGHLFYDIDDEGGFDSVCGSCTEDIDIVDDIVIPSTTNEILENCGEDIIINPIILESKLDFDGIDDYVSTPEFINSLNQVTIMAWVKSDLGNSNNMTVAGEDTGCKLWLKNGNTPTFTIKSVGNSEKEVSCSTINFNEWHHITGTYSSTTGIMSIYVDGELLNSTNVGNTGAAIQNTASSNGNFEIGRTSKNTTNREYFKGDIDEVRVFDTNLTENQIQKIIYQEIENNGGVVSGKVINKDILDFNTNSTIAWPSLIAYYPMSTIISYDRTSDFSIYNRITKLHNITTFQEETAPMPYTTSNNGDWSSQNTWQHGNVWDIENETSNKDWSIIKIKNNITTSNSHGTLGLIIDSGAKLTVNGSNELNNSWYLKLDGEIDLQNESQLVQGAESSLDVTSAGTLERDQQGTKDLYTYNYWSSPVGLSNTTSNNNSYTLPDVLSDGSVVTTPLPITFVTGYNGAPGSPATTPISIASTWIWKYANKLSDDYASWQHVKNTGTLLAGEGYTMKGVDNSATSFTEEQNYIFNGKPNNGDITLTLSAGNDYLIGNPYASAIDANEFILDNISDGAGRATTNIINGTLYFWDHFAGDTHVLREYQGGYATYSLIGGIKAVSTDTRINASGQVGTKVPQQYIPVSQGFFVTADEGGSVTFKNSQRIFKTEAVDPSQFLKGKKDKTSTTKNNSNDNRQKIRLILDSPKGYHRQLLVGVDSSATNGIDKGYDAPLIENNVEDLFWIFNNKNFVIQAVSNFNDNQILPLGIKINQEGLASIKIDELENIHNNKKIYLHDKELSIYHNLKKNKYDVHLAVGEYLNRFEITFSKKSHSLSTDEISNNHIEVFFSNKESNVIVHNPNAQLIESVEMINILGQTLFKFKINSNDDYLKYKASQMKTGTYILKIETEYGKISKKVLIK